MIDGEPWFVAADVCRVLGHSNPTMAVAGLDDDEKKVISADALHANGMTLSSAEGQRGGARKLIIISESGLYALVLTSRKPEAKRFRKWITSQVVPALRRTGRYEIEGREPEALMPSRPETVEGWLRLIELTRKVAGREAARALWAESPLPPLPEAARSRGRGPGDVMARFLIACCEPGGDNHFVRTSALWLAFEAWRAEAGEPGWPFPLFAKRMATIVRETPDLLGPEVEPAKSSASGYRGLRLKEDGE
nr:BRO family protein [Rubellimicrobium aerolatum]